MSKAYDHVEWSFVQAILVKMGFSAKFVAMVMQYISIVTYSVLINGILGNVIKLTRGLKQGDPLSPFLFVIISEALSSLLSTAKERKDISSLNVSRRSPTITHWFFADDSMIFWRTHTQELLNLQSLFAKYECASSQKINYEKSSILSIGIQGTLRLI